MGLGAKLGEAATAGLTGAVTGGIGSIISGGLGLLGGLFKRNNNGRYRDWETDRKSTRLNSSHITRSRMPSSA